MPLDSPSSSSLLARSIQLAELAGACLQPAIEAEGLTRAQFDLLNAVEAHKGQASQIEVAGFLGIHAPAMSSATRKALKDGLIVSTLGADRRERVLSLSSKGRSKLYSVLANFNKLEATLFELIDKDVYHRALDGLEAAVHQLAGSLT